VSKGLSHFENRIGPKTKPCLETDKKISKERKKKKEWNGVWKKAIKYL
jgi:hypothetical protein